MLKVDFIKIFGSRLGKSAKLNPLNRSELVKKSMESFMNTDVDQKHVTLSILYLSKAERLRKGFG